MANRSFGPGTIWAVPLGGTPIKFGTVQDTQVSLKRTLKKLYGKKQFAEEIGAATSELAGKSKYARISGYALAYLFAGVTPSSGQTVATDDEIGLVPGTSAYNVTVANGATWTADLGVFYNEGPSVGLPLQLVPSAPAVGQYTVAAGGVYGFSVADKSLHMRFSYLWTVTGGTTVSVANPVQGVQPAFMLTLQTSFTNKAGVQTTTTLTLFSCVSSSFDFATKQGDFTIPEFDFEAQEDASGNVYRWSFSEAA